MKLSPFLYHLYAKELKDLWPSQSQIDEARHNKGKGRALDHDWDSCWDAVFDNEIATTSGALDKGWNSWGDTEIATTSSTCKHYLNTGKS